MVIRAVCVAIARHQCAALLGTLGSACHFELLIRRGGEAEK